MQLVADPRFLFPSRSREYHKSLDPWNVIRSQGSLDTDDKTKPDELAAEVAKCDTALVLPHNSN